MAVRKYFLWLRVWVNQRITDQITIHWGTSGWWWWSSDSHLSVGCFFSYSSSLFSFGMQLFLPSLSSSCFPFLRKKGWGEKFLSSIFFLPHHPPDDVDDRRFLWWLEENEAEKGCTLHITSFCWDKTRSAGFHRMYERERSPKSPKETHVKVLHTWLGVLEMNEMKLWLRYVINQSDSFILHSFDSSSSYSIIIIILIHSLHPSWCSFPLPVFNFSPCCLVFFMFFSLFSSLRRIILRSFSSASLHKIESGVREEGWCREMMVQVKRMKKMIQDPAAPPQHLFPVNTNISCHLDDYYYFLNHHYLEWIVMMCFL